MQEHLRETLEEVIGITTSLIDKLDEIDLDGSIGWEERESSHRASDSADYLLEHFQTIVKEMG